jgi:hypothetical protein
MIKGVETEKCEWSSGTGCGICEVASRFMAALGRSGRARDANVSFGARHLSVSRGRE